MKNNLDAAAALDSLARSLTARVNAGRISDPAMLGIHTGGVWVAEDVRRRLKKDMPRADIPLGSLDISFYRDDFSRIGLHPQVKPSRIPYAVDGRHIILVDDVLYTGRTIRAALNEIFDYGRPASVTLAVLAERDGRQLPIAADCAGCRMRLDDDRQIKVSGPSPIAMKVARVK